MKINTTFFYEAKLFLLLWITQSFSALGSSMTSYALIIWSYKQEGSALATSLLMVCSYAPYVLLSIFAGAISDRWNKKKIMLVCDAIAACCTVGILILLKTDSLALWHLYAINAINGFMNTIQQPASEVATTKLLPQKYYQQVGSLRYLSNSCNGILTPIVATAVLAFAGIDLVILIDLCTFAVAFIVLLFFIKIPETNERITEKETFLQSTKAGLVYLKENRGILDLILFLACINFTASIVEAAMPAMILSRTTAGETSLGIVKMFRGITLILGSMIASLVKKPKSRVKIVCNTLLFSMLFENFILALCKSTPLWCVGEFLGWIFIPLMSANLDVILRKKIPIELQGRVFAARNTLQFFTIPTGYFLGGILIDKILEPFIAAQNKANIITFLFGNEKGGGAASLFFIVSFIGIATCLVFRKDRHILKLDKDSE